MYYKLIFTLVLTGLLSTANAQSWQPPAEQDRVLRSMEAGTSTQWPAEGIADMDFFELVRAMTIMGFMADPKYGGNAEFSGWKVARYPGPRHHQGGYTPAQMQGEEEIITIWGGKM